MVEFFNALGVEVNYIIPNRFTHGYGLSAKVLDNIYDGLVITVDNGITALQAADICVDRGLDLIITDHHTVGDTLPKAYAIVNPKQYDCDFPFKDICGAQVAWYLCAMVKKELKIDFNLATLFDILALAIVADIMPMRSLNQTIVKKGLKAIEQSQRPAFLVLKEKLNLTTITEDDIGFKIAPLINCAGRIEDATVALEFLLSFDTFEAKEFYEYLFNLNEQRKLEQLKIYEEAKLQIDNSDDVIVVSSQNWNEGIVGIVASKLTEKYKKPAFVFSIKDGMAKGSSRSSNVHLYNLIYQCKDLLIGFGGHKGAAGMTIKANQLETFKQKLNTKIKTIPKDDSFSISSMGKLNISYINSTLYNMIDQFRPFGLDNELPTFVFENVIVINIKKIGKNKEFTKLLVKNDSANIEVVVFVDCNQFIINEKISFIATISQNKFMDKITYNLIFKEFY
jgi:single-stranded-DNA-specific exonuclease